MKAKDLMIGDWVYVHHNGKAPHYGKVTALLSSGAVETEINGSLALSSSVDPIPLTPEILEKNGFKKCEQGYMWKERIGIGGQTVSASSPIEIIVYEGGHSFVSNPHGGKAYQGSIDYVHELQHALRICGIKKK